MTTWKSEWEHEYLTGTCSVCSESFRKEITRLYLGRITPAIEWLYFRCPIDGCIAHQLHARNTQSRPQEWRVL